MIAYLVHTGIISDNRVGWMEVTGNDGMRHHPNAGVKTGCTSLSLWVSVDKVWMALFSPLMLHIGASSDYSVGLIIHVGKVGDEEEIGTAEKR